MTNKRRNEHNISHFLLLASFDFVTWWSNHFHAILDDIWRILNVTCFLSLCHSVSLPSRVCRGSSPRFLQTTHQGVHKPLAVSGRVFQEVCGRRPQRSRLVPQVCLQTVHLYALRMNSPIAFCTTLSLSLSLSYLHWLKHCPKPNSKMIFSRDAVVC